ncbi:MAG TPA: tetratricopeptide repeat protein [Burkholderiales bacterium]
MALDLEEQEKVAELKAWWQMHGNRIVAVLVAAALAIAGWQAWRWYQAAQTAGAGALYDAVARAAATNDAKTLREASGALIQDYSGTLYATMGALTAARFYFEQKDLKSARVQLEWAVENSPSDDFRDLARLRLAAVLLEEKSYDEALRQLEQEHAPAYDAQFAALRGDVLVAKNDLAQARAAYKLALEKMDPGNAAFRESVRMRLEALGG